MHFLKLRCASDYHKNWNVDKIAPPTEAQKKRRRFSTMFTLHALMCNAKIRHENEHTLTCSGYIKTKDRF